MKKYSLLFLVLLLTACGQGIPTVAPTPTPNPGEIALSMMQSQLEAKATEQIVGLQFTATAQILGVTATAQQAVIQAGWTQQARMDAQSTAEQRRMDIQATQQRIDADATQAQARREMEIQATQARMDIESTQQAQATANAFSMTQVVMPTHNLWTQQAVEQQIILGTNAVELSNLAVKQQQQTNTIDWAIPVLIAMSIALAAVIYILRYSQAREFRDEDGNVDVIVFNNEKAVKPALFTAPVLLLDSMTMPQLAAPEEQARVTERAQAIEALRAMPTQTTGAAAQAFNKYFSSDKPRFSVLGENEMPPVELLNPETLKSIEADWSKDE